FWLTPDNAALDVTGDTDFRIAMKLADWTPASQQGPASKYDNTPSSAQSWQFLILNGSGDLSINWVQDASHQETVVSSATGIADASVYAVRWVIDFNPPNRTVTFYKKATTPEDALADCESDSGWTQIGSADTAVAFATSIQNSTSSLAIGGHEQD